MKEKKITEALGYIEKEETLALWATKAKINEMVLEDIDPFPGYYGGILHRRMPDDTDPRNTVMPREENKPNFLFFVIQPVESCLGDRIIRIIQRIKNKVDFDFDAWPGQLTLYNKQHSCLRVMIEDNELIPKLIEQCKDNGIKFEKQKKIRPYKSMIRVIKFFALDELDKGIYKDTVQADTAYFQIPHEITWKSFEKHTMIIKNSYNYRNFDAALAALYQPNGFLDFVRIYTKLPETKQIKQLQEQYIAEIKRERVNT